MVASVVAVVVAWGVAVVGVEASMARMSAPSLRDPGIFTMGVLFQAAFSFIILSKLRAFLLGFFFGHLLW